MSLEVVYNASPTMVDFHACEKMVRCMMGPVGSGKSTAMCMEMNRRGQEQEKDLSGKRKTKWAVVRNTYPELRDTTVATWLDWFPEDVFGPFNWTYMRHDLHFDDVEMAVLFRALDKPKDVKKLLSLELTGAWVNEAREVPKGIIDALGDRVGRYPPPKDGVGPTWHGMIMDTNPPDSDHWWYAFSERDMEMLAKMEVDPDDLDKWAFFKQPGGLIEVDGRFILNPAAENVENLVDDYYIDRMVGKSRDHIKVYYCAEYGFVVDGKPIYADYKDSTHCPSEDIEPVKGVPLTVGIDFGLTPAAIIGQVLPNGRATWLDEFVTENMGAKRFGRELLRYMDQHFRDFEVSDWWGDPAGDQRAQTDETTPFQILRSLGIPAKPAPSNDFVLRTEAVAEALRSLVDGVPGLLVSPKCTTTRKGMAGGYCYKRVQVGGEARFQDKPDKNKYSHPCEAGQYFMLGSGFGRKVLKRAEKSTPRQSMADSEFKFFGSKKSKFKNRQMVAD